MGASDQKTAEPLRHYMRIYRELDPHEIARRCSIEFDHEKSAFSLRLMGTGYYASFPEFALISADGEHDAHVYETILLLRYLCEGKLLPPHGKQLSYNEIPWGEVYYRNFEGRCLRRFALAFGRDVPAFAKMIGQNPRLGAVPVSKGDAAYRIEFINGLFITVILWQGDDEFPPSSQILFDDNFVFAFTAEDIAVVGDVLINRLKAMLP